MIPFFFNDTATTEIYTYGHTLSLHDALPIWAAPTRSRSRKGGEACFVPHSPFPPLTLDRVVHLVLERMRHGAERGDFLHLQPDVGVDEVVGHHAAGLEELAVGVEGFERLVERVAHGRNVLFLFGRQVVQVLVAGEIGRASCWERVCPDVEN